MSARFGSEMVSGSIGSDMGSGSLGSDGSLNSSSFMASSFLKEAKVERIDYNYRISILGDSSVGKSSLLYNELETFATKEAELFSGGPGIKFETKMFYALGYNHQVQFWDTPGNPIYTKHVIRYCAGSAGIVFVYDITNIESFQRVEDIASELSNITKDIPAAVVGNKLDLPNRQVTSEQGQQLAKRLNADFIETNALKGVGVHEIFNGLVSTIARSLPDPPSALPLLRRNIRYSDKLLINKKDAILKRLEFQREPYPSNVATEHVDWMDL
eukprot:Partr_v1_DN25883_c0_g1_i2_m2710 putative Ras-related protein